MPALFSIAIHIVLREVQEMLADGENAFAFLDDIYVVSLPDRTRAIFNMVHERLRHHAGIEVHLGKTRVWNAAGEEPADMSSLQTAEAAQTDPIWVGNWAFLPEKQGLLALGTPVGREEYARQKLHDKRLEHVR